MWLAGIVGFCILVIAGVISALFIKRVFDPVAREFGWW